MKNLIISSLLLLTTILLSSWGFFAHKLINRHSVYSLPKELAAFYKEHIDEITERAVDADKRCYSDTNESPRHYIDLDDFQSDSVDSIPIHWSDAIEKYEERKLLAIGIVPWQINLTYQNLVRAFSERNTSKIIRYSADLGHYVADAHVPLHTTRNYNGQETGQIGIHAFWESRLPQLYVGSYDLLVGKAIYITDPLEQAWKIVKESNELVNEVLQTERKLSKEIPESQQRSYSNLNGSIQWTYSDFYCNAYHEALNGMVERRMKESILMVSSLWFSAWVDAGQPILSKANTQHTFVRDSSENVKTKRLGREEWQ
ncbi:zinc dependent phospholipase C family protein [Sphingobacterium hungaricum]